MLFLCMSVYGCVQSFSCVCVCVQGSARLPCTKSQPRASPTTATVRTRTCPPARCALRQIGEFSLRRAAERLAAAKRRRADPDEDEAAALSSTGACCFHVGCVVCEGGGCVGWGLDWVGLPWVGLQVGVPWGAGCSANTAMPQHTCAQHAPRELNPHPTPTLFTVPLRTHPHSHIHASINPTSPHPTRTQCPR